MGNDPDAPLFWPCWAVGTVLLLALTAYFGTGSDHLASVARVPRLVSLVAAGAEKMPAYAFAAGFVPLAIGASLGASSARRSLMLVLLGTALMTLPVILAILLQGLAGLSQQRPANGFSPATPMILYFITMAPAGFFLICKPIAIGGAAFCIVIHLVLNVLNGLPMPWQSLSEGDDAESLYEVGGGALIVLLAVWTFFPNIIFGRDPLKDEGATAEEIAAALDPPYNNRAWYLTPAGRDRMRKAAGEITDQIGKVKMKPCEVIERRSLKGKANRYFDYIRVYEDWKANTPLTDISRGAVHSIEYALDRGLIGWDDLVPATRIHLNKKKYESAVRTYPESCGT
jgi:hypothetical protein